MSPSVPVKFRVQPIRCGECGVRVRFIEDIICDTDLMRVWVLVGSKAKPSVTLVIPNRKTGGPIVRGQEVKCGTPNSTAYEGYLPHETVCGGRD